MLFRSLPITYLFLFQFISSPSPDLPIYIFAFLILSIYLQTTNIVDRFTILSILCLYAVFIKITAVALLLFPIIVLIKNYKILKRQLVKIILVGSSIIVVFITKNTLLTGYALFPLLFLRIDSLDYTVPSSVMNFFFSKSMLYSFYVDNADFDTLSILDLIKHYFINNGLLGFIGIASVCTLFIIPFLLFKKRLVSSIWTIYFAFIILIFLLIFSSPQYRFYVYFTLFFSVVLLSFLISNPNQIIRLQTVSLSVVAFFLFVPISFSNLTSNILLNKNSTFKIKNTIVPEPNSKWNSEFRGGSVGNMKYNSPLDNSFFWVTGNGELPCVNTTQIDYFHKGFSFIPQQRSNDLNDGFYAQKVNNDE